MGCCGVGYNHPFWDTEHYPGQAGKFLANVVQPFSNWRSATSLKKRRSLRILSYWSVRLVRSTRMAPFLDPLPLRACRKICSNS